MLKVNMGVGLILESVASGLWVLSEGPTTVWLTSLFCFVGALPTMAGCAVAIFRGGTGLEDAALSNLGGSDKSSFM